MTNERKILVVEDSLVTAAYLKHFFTGEGYKEVLVTDSGTEAVGLFSHNIESLDLAILDIELPDTYGISLAKKLRSIEASREIGEMLVPIFMMSANFNQDRKAACLEIGVQGLFEKPISSRHENIMRNAIEARRLIYN